MLVRNSEQCQAEVAEMLLMQAFVMRATVPQRKGFTGLNFPTKIANASRTARTRKFESQRERESYGTAPLSRGFQFVYHQCLRSRVIVYLTRSQNKLHY